MGRGMMDGTRVVGFVMRLAGVLDIGNVARVSVIDVVGHSLKTTVGELNMVLALGGVAITALSGTKVEAVLISDTVLVGVVGGSGLIVGLMVASVDGGMMHGGVMDRGVMDYWGMVNRGVVDGGMMHGGMVDGGMMDWGVDGAMAVSASTRVGVDEGHEGQDCREGLKHGIKLSRILCSS